MTADLPPFSPRFQSSRPIAGPAGRQHGVFVIERLLDIAARELGLDRAEIRRRNFIAPDAFPYDNHIIYQDFAPLHYDSGDYGQVLDRHWRRSAITHSLPRSSRSCGLRVGAWASASCATSKAPALAPMRAPESRSKAAAGCCSRPASARRVRAISLASPRS